MSYECHITMIGDDDRIETMVKESGWFFSKIDQDPLLGTGVKCYATKHFPMSFHLDYVIEQVNILAEAYGCFSFCNVLRQKVEQIMYDTKGVKK